MHDKAHGLFNYGSNFPQSFLVRYKSECLIFISCLYRSSIIHSQKFIGDIYNFVFCILYPSLDGFSLLAAFRFKFTPFAWQFITVFAWIQGSISITTRFSATPTRENHISGMVGYREWFILLSQYRLQMAMEFARNNLSIITLTHAILFNASPRYC